MIFGERTYNTLVVSASGKLMEFLSPLLPVTEYWPVTVTHDIGSAKRTMLESEYDIIIINTPLPDEFGCEFASDVCQGSDAGVLLFVKSELAEGITARVCEFGAYVLPKPVSKPAVTSALKLLTATRERLRRMEKKYETLEDKMEEIRLVNRAKWILIEYLKMTENEAHRFVEKQAMDMRITKRAAAENIIRTYDKN
jgi:Response regulator with putative antiterminator output domain